MWKSLFLCECVCDRFITMAPQSRIPPLVMPHCLSPVSCGRGHQALREEGQAAPLPDCCEYRRTSKGHSKTHVFTAASTTSSHGCGYSQGPRPRVSGQDPPGQRTPEFSTAGAQAQRIPSKRTEHRPGG